MFPGQLFEASFAFRVANLTYARHFYKYLSDLHHTIALVQNLN